MAKRKKKDFWFDFTSFWWTSSISLNWIWPKYKKMYDKKSDHTGPDWPLALIFSSTTLGQWQADNQCCWCCWCCCYSCSYSIISVKRQTINSRVYVYFALNSSYFHHHHHRLRFRLNRKSSFLSRLTRKKIGQSFFHV